MQDSNQFLQTAKKAVQEAGSHLLEISNQHHKLEWGDKVFEGYRTIKSQADKQSETIILDIIRNQFPDHAILSEESGLHESSNNFPYTWIVDPLHDTVAYVRGNRPEFSVTIALAKDDSIIIAALYQPFINRLYTAVKNKGAYLNDEPITVSNIQTISESNLSIQHNAFKYGDYEKVITLSKQVKRMYALGSAMFPELASGWVDIVVSYKQALYDYAASKLIVEEAGGKVTQVSGEAIPLKLDNKRRYTIVATNSLLHKETLEHLS